MALNQELKIIGIVTKDAEMKEIKSGGNNILFTVAVNTYNSITKTNEATFYTCSKFMPASAKTDGILKTLAKGNYVCVSGKPKPYIQNKDFSTKKEEPKLAIGISVDEHYLIKFADKAKDDNGKPTQKTQDNEEDDLPF